ncbi:hypothetical protein K8352_12760 [Flavobacteriaceae bacterium F89]|uniref:Uncharacterized protein n=1 Tax=Cerina litoralis TaxID=2874477 RepID=A0AAE3JQ96_9FLAO|nr:hypothetical protein [Cerina litoralis]MCG2461624.1 hypothetical protein [Cerina litoralis]
MISSCKPQVEITDDVISEKQPSFKIATPTATYLYQKEAGGFSSIYDANGTDWIQFHKTDSAGYPHSSASDYRGLPNLVYGSDDSGSGHPGFKKMTSEQISENRIRSTSMSGKWQWSWTFHENYAALNIEKIDPDQAYFFLYEGPIAGTFSPATHYWGTDIAGPMNKQPDFMEDSILYGKWQTVYFGNREYDKTFFLKQKEADTLQDMYAYLGNSPNGNQSPDGMVVFGFGREKVTMPLLTSKNSFIIGFYNHEIEDAKGHKTILRYIDRLTR